jgi:outer membrane protein OmpA-like peptidoglycan-associated protein
MGAPAAAFAERRRAPEAADPVERRAESVDRPVAAAALALLPRGAVVQRACCVACESGAPCEDERQGLQVIPPRHPLEREADRVAARAVHAGGPAGGEQLGRAPAAPAASLAFGTGKPLPEAERAFFEPRLGRDLGDVRIHTGDDAAGAAQALDARAFTTGRDVVFGAGEYAPETGAGRLLLAHELAHTSQQAGGGAVFREEMGGEQPQPPAAEGALGEVVSGLGAALGPAAGLIAGVAATALGSSTGPACRTDPPVFTPGPQLFFDFDSDALLPGQGPLISSLLTDAICAASIEFHGNSSSEGPPAHNADLACRRAAAVAALFSGIPVPQLLVGHGGTTAYGSAPPSRTAADPNRNVVVAMTFKTSPPPLPTRSVAAPSSTPALMGTFAPPGGCGAGDDSKSADFPPVLGSITTRSVFLIGAADLLGDATLETGLDTELVTLAGAGSAGTAALARFNAGTGGTAVHAPGSTLSLLMSADPSFLGPFHTVEADVQAQARTQAAGGSLDFSLFRVTPPRIFFPPTSTGVGSGPLASVLGGTQGTRIFVISFVVMPCTRTYTAILRFVVCDDFGVDQGDVKTPGLAGFWVLQHRRPPGHVAFINEVVVDMLTTGTF